MIRAAVIFESSPFDRKGLFNAVHNRIRHLKDAGGCEVDVYCIHSRDSFITRKLRHTPEVSVKDEVMIDGIRYRLMWYRFSVADHITVKYLRRRPFFFSRFISGSVGLLEGYDCIIAHSFTGGILAQEASSRYAVPYYITWHGSDVHTHPWRNPLILKDTRSLMEGAECNFFVSASLMAESDRITTSARKDVLYNGASEQFYRFPQERREALRKEYGLEVGDKVVAFAGNLVPVKNVSSLYGIFSRIGKCYDGPVKFWVIGDGKLRRSVEDDFSADASLDVRFWGNVKAEDMPSLMNCVDVLVLPSLNEGLPLVCAEALSCGANVVGSDVGGIPEIIGNGFTVAHSDTFAMDMASKAAALLAAPVFQDLPSYISWKSTAAKEMEYLSASEPAK